MVDVEVDNMADEVADMEVDKVADIVVMKPNEDLTDMTLVVDMYVDKVAGNG